LDGGIINSISNFVNESVDKSGFPDWYWWKTTRSANVTLPILSEGVHNVTVYYGWQYLGTPENPSLERYEVFSIKTVEFTVDNSPPKISQLSIEDFIPAIVLSGIIAIVVAVSLLLYFKKCKKESENKS
jgi:hypothetical protein